MSVRKSVNRLIERTLAGALRRLPDESLSRVLVEAASAKARSLPADRGLRFLFRLDELLYPVQGGLSVKYDGGLHTKHRHTRYHDFFIDRITEADRVLDVGCGIGALAHDIADKTGARVVGIDLNEDQIRAARTRYAHPNVDHLVGDVRSDLPDRRFDVVVMSNVLEHVEDRVDLLRSIARTARPRELLLRAPMFERDWRVPLKEELGLDYRLDPTHEIEYTVEDFASELADAGLSIVEQQCRWGEIWARAVPDVREAEGRGR
jgi:ubiquinone/menaquinone biosynthesis C-methylase UbiE